MKPQRCLWFHVRLHEERLSSLFPISGIVAARLFAALLLIVSALFGALSLVLTILLPYIIPPYNPPFKELRP